MKEKVLEALKQVRPMLQRDGGDIELVSVEENGTVKVRLKGACGSCPMSTMTLKMGVEKYLKDRQWDGLKQWLETTSMPYFVARSGPDIVRLPGFADLNRLYGRVQ